MNLFKPAPVTKITACGKCGARTFYNSRVAIDILKRNMRELDHD